MIGGRGRRSGEVEARDRERAGMEIRQVDVDAVEPVELVEDVALLLERRGRARCRVTEIRLPSPNSSRAAGNADERDVGAPAAVREPILDPVLRDGRDHELARRGQGQQGERDDQEPAWHCRPRVAASLRPHRGERLPARELSAALTAAVRPRGVEAKPHLARIKPLVQDWGVNGFGTPTLRLPALRRQAGRLRRSAALLVISTDARARGARRLRRLVDRADRLPEVRGLDAALGDPRARRRLDAAQLPLHAADRRAALLAAARDGAAAAVAGQGAADRAAPTARSLDVVLYAGVLASGLYLLLAGGTDAAGTDAGRLDPAAIAVLLGFLGAARPARQGLRSSAPARRSTARPGRLPLPARPVDRRLAVRLPLHLVGRRLLEAQPPLPLRRLGDDQQRAAGTAPKALKREALARPPGGPAALAAGGRARPPRHGAGVHAAAAPAHRRQRRSSGRSRSSG